MFHMKHFAKYYFISDASFLPPQLITPLWLHAADPSMFHMKHCPGHQPRFKPANYKQNYFTNC